MITVNQVSTLNRLIIEQMRRESDNSLATFIQAAWPILEPSTPFVNGWHIEAICEHLEAVYEGQIKNLLINIPPRHAKSSIVSIAFPAWVWTKRAHHKFLFGSHSFNLSKRDSVKCRNVIQSAWYRNTFNILWKLSEDQNEKMRFDNTAGGSRIASSVSSSIIGQGGDTLVLDDPHSPTSVRSDVQRENELEWMDQEFFTRINDPKTASKIIIMQRLDERDASKHVLDKGDWEHLMIPAEFEVDRKCYTSIGWSDPRKEEGEPLWPERFSVDDLQKMKVGMGSKSWAGQGQQRPSPAEGNIVKREWFKFYKALPAEVNFSALSVDLSFSEGTTNSFAHFALWAKNKGERYLIKEWRKQMGFNEQLATFRAASLEKVNGQSINAKWVEKKANGAALIQVVEKEIPGVIAVEPKGSKEARLDAVSPQFEAGNVYLPDPTVPGNEWVLDFIEEIVTFPNALHNDRVDTTSQALLKLNEASSTDFKIVSLKGASKWLGR